MTAKTAEGFSARAIVAHEPIEDQLIWKLEDVTVLRDLQPTELLVRIVSTGICHTDVVFSTWPKEAIPYPKVLGHEGKMAKRINPGTVTNSITGSGYVEQVGSEVKSASVGDSVLLSFQSCSTCKDCLDKHPSFCQVFAPANYGGDQDVFQIAGGVKSAGGFFGQSSFASHTIVKESSVVNVSTIVKSEEELRLFAPLGCGFQSGMGTVDNLAGGTEKDSIVIIGLGGVGLTAIMVFI